MTDSFYSGRGDGGYHRNRSRSPPSDRGHRGGNSRFSQDNRSYYPNNHNSNRGRNNNRRDFDDLGGGAFDYSEEREGDRGSWDDREYYNRRNTNHPNQNHHENHQTDPKVSIPNNVIMIRALGQNVTESDISAAIMPLSLKPIYIRLIKDKDSGSHRGYAFVKFASVEEAVELLEIHESNPVYIGGEMCKMDFSNVNNMQNDWTCRQCQAYNFERRDVCFKCGQAKPAVVCHSDGTPANDGSHDICPYPSRFLLIRKLNMKAKPDAVYASLKNLNPHLNRIYFMNDSSLKAAFLGYAFAEYSNLEASQMTLSLISSLPSFSLCGRPVEVTFGRDLLLNPDGTTLDKANYWDSNVILKPFPSKPDDHSSNVQNVLAPPIITPAVMISLEVISRLVFNEGIGYFEDPVTGSLYSFNASNNTYSLIKTGTKLEDQAKVIKAGAFAMPSSSSMTATRASISLTPVAQKSQKKIQIQLQKWQTRQQETLKEEPSEKTALTETFVKADDGSSEASASRTGIKGFSDYVLMACLLCQRQFKSAADLDRHTELSELHKTNLKKHEEKEKKQLEMEKQEYDQQQQQYRNRAEERRKRGGADEQQPLKKSEAFIGYGSTSAGGYVEQPTVKGIGTDNIGNRMLQKMGWKAGEGLGKNKSGIVEPIAAASKPSSSKVGLGTSERRSGFDSSSSTSTYQAKVWDRSRARYQELDESQSS